MFDIVDMQPVSDVSQRPVGSIEERIPYIMFPNGYLMINILL